MNNRNNKGGGTAPFPAGRFGSRPWTSARINPLQQLAAAAAGGASHMSTGISYGSAARAQATTDSQAPPPPKVPNFRQPHSQPHTQFDPSLAFPPPSQAVYHQQHQQHYLPGAFISPPLWSQPSQPEFDLSNANSDPTAAAAPLAGSNFGEALQHSQPSQTAAAKLLEQLHGKSAPSQEASQLLLREILQKLETLQRNHTTMSDAVQGVETQLQAMKSEVPPPPPSAAVPPTPDSDTQQQQQQQQQMMVEVMEQALNFMKTAAQRPITTEMATQTSPCLFAPPPVAVVEIEPQLVERTTTTTTTTAHVDSICSSNSKNTTKKKKKEEISTTKQPPILVAAPPPPQQQQQRGKKKAPLVKNMKKTAEAQVQPLFPVLLEPHQHVSMNEGNITAGQKRSREADSGDDENDMFASRLARRVQKHRQIKSQLPKY